MSFLKFVLYFRIVAKLHNMEVFRYCCPFQNSVQHELALIIKVRNIKYVIDLRNFFKAGTIEWFDRMITEITKPRLRVRVN
jgi:hypothetical protein